MQWSIYKLSRVRALLVFFLARWIFNFKTLEKSYIFQENSTFRNTYLIMLHDVKQNQKSIAILKVV